MANGSPSFEFACRECFADKELQQWLDGQPDLETGTCAWCDSEQVRLIPLEELGPLFRDVATMYTPNDGTHSFILSELGAEYAAGTVLRRARIHQDREQKERFGPADLGAPPADNTTAGRANRKGEPVLYTATDEATAVAEVRPWRGAPVAIARIQIQGKVRILDLTNLDPLGSPFFRENIGWMVEARGLLWQPQEDLKRPVTPHDAERQYQPTQYACDLMREAGFDGVAFPSAMGPGQNVVLFNPTAGTVVQVNCVRVAAVGYESVSETAETIDVDDFPY